jgi:L-ascorbate metabolism protein UlaG (beta-lactamase superfamily)
MPFSLPRLRLPSLTELRYLRIMLLDVRRPVEPAPNHPAPAAWPDNAVTAAWLGHSTVLINFFGIHILTDPSLRTRTGIRVGPLVFGPKRYVAPALTQRELPRIDFILLSHAHMDHFDLPTLARFRAGPKVVTARRTADLLRRTRLRHDVTELGWGERARLPLGRTGDAARDELEIEAFEVRHWGARMRTDDFRGYNGYILRRNGRAVLYSGDTAYTTLFQRLRGRGGTGNGGAFDLGIFPIGAYDPWIGSHCTPEQAVEMAGMAGVRFILPVHHQTFKLSREPMDEPIRRLECALSASPERIALRAIGETFRLPQA